MPEKYRLKDPGNPQYISTTGDDFGCFLVDKLNKHFPLRCIASNGMGWEHVSVSMDHRKPTWQEMCCIKELFWDADDCVIQYHPPESNYVNIHPNCLHLWRPVDQEIIMPPTMMV